MRSARSYSVGSSRPPAKSTALAQVPQEGGVDDDRACPTPSGSSGATAIATSRHQVGAALVQLHQLIGGEAPAEAPPQLGDDLVDHSLEDDPALGRRRREPALAGLPLVERVRERHRGRA